MNREFRLSSAPRHRTGKHGLSQYGPSVTVSRHLKVRPTFFDISPFSYKPTRKEKFFCVMLCLCGIASFSSSARIVGDVPQLPIEGVRFFAGLLNQSIPDYGMITQEGFGQKDDLDDGINDGLWCQTSKFGKPKGRWIRPDGQKVSSAMDTTDPLYVVDRCGQSGLLRTASIHGDPFQGLYKCFIPDKTGKEQTLVIWIGGSDLYQYAKDHNGLGTNMSWSLPTQSLVEDSLEFMLSFSFRILPPTNVTCELDHQPVHVESLSREVVTALQNSTMSENSLVHVAISATVRSRQAGTYQCSVTVFIGGLVNYVESLPPLTTQVTGSPTQLTAALATYSTVELSWSAPAKSGPPVAGYEVFYAPSGSSEKQSRSVSSNTFRAVLNGLGLNGTSYDFAVVAISDAPNVLPSVPSATLTVEMGLHQSADLLMVASTSRLIDVEWSHVKLTNAISSTITTACSLLCDDSTIAHTSISPPANQSSATATELLPGSACNVTLAVLFDTGNSMMLTTATETVLELPVSAPDGLMASPDGSTSLRVVWNPLSCSLQNGPITGYVVDYNDTMVDVPGGSQTELTVANLTSNTLYSVRVAAVNDAGRSSFSSPIHACTGPPAFIFQAVVSFSAFLLLCACSGLTMTVTWTRRKARPKRTKTSHKSILRPPHELDEEDELRAKKEQLMKEQEIAEIYDYGDAMARYSRVDSVKEIDPYASSDIQDGGGHLYAEVTPKGNRVAAAGQDEHVTEEKEKGEAAAGPDEYVYDVRKVAAAGQEEYVYQEEKVAAARLEEYVYNDEKVAAARLEEYVYNDEKVAAARLEESVYNDEKVAAARLEEYVYNDEKVAAARLEEYVYNDKKEATERLEEYVYSDKESGDVKYRLSSEEYVYSTKHGRSGDGKGSPDKDEYIYSTEHERVTDKDQDDSDLLYQRIDSLDAPSRPAYMKDQGTAQSDAQKSISKKQEK